MFIYFYTPLVLSSQWPPLYVYSTCPAWTSPLLMHFLVEDFSVASTLHPRLTICLFQLPLKSLGASTQWSSWELVQATPAYCLVQQVSPMWMCFGLLDTPIESSTAITYTSHLQSCLSFCKLHHLLITPIIDTFSFYLVYMCKPHKPLLGLPPTFPASVTISKPYFSSIQMVWNNPLMVHSLTPWRNWKGSIPTIVGMLLCVDMWIAEDVLRTAK